MPGIPSNIILRNLTNPPVKGRTSPIIATDPDRRDGSRGGGSGGSTPGQGLIFSDNFAAIPNTTSNTGLTPELIASGWTASRQGGDNGGPHFTPDQGYPDNGYPWEISDDPKYLRNGTGKALVLRRESYSLSGGGAGWNSDGVLYARLPSEYNELFSRFWMKFEPNWTPGGMSKIFRALHFDDVDGQEFSYFSDGHSAPILLWDYNENQYGVRHVVACRADPQETNYFPATPPITNTPRAFQQGDASLNFDDDIRDLDGDGTDDNPITMTDLTTGQPLAPGAKFHDQIYGKDVWFKLEFYVKMNSAPGAQDGVLMVWVRDQLVFKNTTMPWMGTDSPGGLGWNAVALGGNDNWNAYPNSEARQEWSAITDFEVYDSLPEDKQ